MFATLFSILKAFDLFQLISSTIQFDLKKHASQTPTILMPVQVHYVYL